MRFWDSSAIVPLILEEPTCAALRSRYRDDPVVVTWWGTPVECASAIARRSRRQGANALADQAYENLALLRARWQEVGPSEGIRERALRLLRVHDLRAADALQLAAALFAAEGRPFTLGLVCLDDRLSAAARLEGFTTARVTI